MEVTRYIKKLYCDCGWKSLSKFKCNICYAEECIDIDTKTETYDKAKPLIFEHIINNHPEYCYVCDNCPQLFCNKGDLTKHKRIHKKPTKKFLKTLEIKPKEDLKI